MATPARTSPAPTSNTSPRRRPVSSSPARPPSGSIPLSSGQGLARAPSIRQSRLSRRPTARMNKSLGSDSTADQDEDERNATAQLIADLQLQVQRAEHASEQYRKHLELMQERLDKSTNDLTLAEERDFQRQTQLDRLQAEVKDTARQRRELDIAHESEMRMLLQERERQASREAGLQSVINRLNETLRNKEHERLSSDHQAVKDPSVPVSSGSRIHVQEPDFAQVDTSVQIMQGKDSTIEQLRLELADLHLKAAEQELSSQSHLQTLEKRVTELRVQNARLQEENESFQMLLSEKTLKGDFMAESRDMSTLAEELETANVDPDTQTDICRKLEAELKAAREENKGLTLYIDKIIGRLLQHDGFEHIVDSSDQGHSTASARNAIRLDQVEKALPPAPGEDSVGPDAPPDAPAAAAPAAAPAAVTSAAQTLLKRAGSLMSRSGNVRPSRPMSIAQPLAVPSSANENPVTAPSIPLSRGHRRSRSDQPSPDPGAAVVVQQMNRGSPLRAASGGPQTPGSRTLSPQMQPRTTYFPNPQQHSPPQQSRLPSNPRQADGSSRNSIMSDHSQDRSSTEASSLQYPNLPGAVMKQNHLRPLRLVQEQSRGEEEIQRRLNRSSWIGWLKGGATDTHQEEQR